MALRTLGLGLALLLGAPEAGAQQRSWPGLSSKDARPEAEDEDAAGDEDERIGGEQLRARLPSLRTRAEPRVIQGTLGFGTRLLYLPLNLEGTLDLYPLPWLRVGLVYAAGVSFKWDGEQTIGTFAQYGEAAVGLRLWSKLSQTDADLQLRRSIGGYGERCPSGPGRAGAISQRCCRFGCRLRITCSWKAARSPASSDFWSARQVANRTRTRSTARCHASCSSRSPACATSTIRRR